MASISRPSRVRRSRLDHIGMHRRFHREVPIVGRGPEGRWLVLLEVFFRRAQRIRSHRADFTSARACNAPNTSIEAMVARASSGVTSSAMEARPNTWIWSFCPAAQARSPRYAEAYAAKHCRDQHSLLLAR